jgi:hypothetical protein
VAGLEQHALHHTSSLFMETDILVMDRSVEWLD